MKNTNKIVNIKIKYTFSSSISNSKQNSNKFCSIKYKNVNQKIMKYSSSFYKINVAFNYNSSYY